MKRLWRSVCVVGVCFAAVVAMRIYLTQQVEFAKAISTSAEISGQVTTQ
jgi:hypothetical protein